MNIINKSETETDDKQKKVGFEVEPILIPEKFQETKQTAQLFAVNSNPEIHLITVSLDDVKRFKPPQKTTWQKIKSLFGIPNINDPKTLQKIINWCIGIGYPSHVIALQKISSTSRNTGTFGSWLIAITLGLFFEAVSYFAGRMKIRFLSIITSIASALMTMIAFKPAYYINGEIDYFTGLFFLLLSVTLPSIASFSTDRLQEILDKKKKIDDENKIAKAKSEQENPELKKTYTREQKFSDTRIREAYDWIISCLSNNYNPTDKEIQERFGCGEKTAKNWKSEAKTLYDEKREKLILENGIYQPNPQRAKVTKKTVKKSTVPVREDKEVAK